MSRILVTGLTGNIGYGVAQAALAQGHEVVGIVRRAKDAHTLREQLGDGLQTVLADLGDPISVSALQTNLPTIDHAVVAVGAWWQKGPVAQQSAAEWDAVRRGGLDTQVHAAMAMLPVLARRPSASYTLITGAAGLMTLANTGLLVAAVAGVMGLSRMLRVEHAQGPVRVNEVLIETRIERHARDGVVPALVFGEAVSALWREDGPRSKQLHFDSKAVLR